MTALLAEELLLLLIDDRTGAPAVDGASLDLALGGALLLELSLLENLELGVAEKADRKRLVRGAGAEPTHPLLAEALARSVDRSPGDAIKRSAEGVRDRLLDGLATQGVVRRERSRVLGLFPRTRSSTTSTSIEDDARSRLGPALVDGAEPGVRTAALICLLHAVEAEHKALPGHDRKELRRRAEEISRGEWAGAEIRSAIQAVQAEVLLLASMATITAATIVISS
jgi:hypothetical protein